MQWTQANPSIQSPMMNFFIAEFPSLAAEAFKPRKDDSTGLSLTRAKYKSASDAAIGASKHGYYVAVLKAGDLRACGIEVEPDPLDDNPGHAQLPGIDYGNRKSSDVEDLQMQLADELCIRVEGPFHTSN